MKGEIEWEKEGINYLENDLTQREVAKKLGVSLSTVNKYFKKFDIAKPTIDWDKVEDEYRRGLFNQKEISEKLGVTTSCVYKNLKKRRIEKDSDIWEDVAEEYATTSVTLAELGKRLGLCSKTVSNRMRKYRYKGNPDESLGGKYSVFLAEKNKETWLKEKCYVYKMRLYNDEESFYKIGMSIDPHKRASMIPYQYEMIEIIPTNKYDGAYLEARLHEKHKKLPYLPLIHFPGYGECFRQLMQE